VNFNRREFIAASAVLGAAAALAPKLTGPSSWFGGPPSGAATLSGIQILRSAQAEPETFEKGLRASLETAGMDASKVATRTLSGKMSWKEWQTLTAMAPGTMLVGMVSEAEFILVNELFREKGARVLSQGNHQVGNAAQTRHAFTTTDASAGLGGVFAQWLKQGRQHALVQETSTRKSTLAHQRSGKSDAKEADWCELLGRAMGQVALGRWEPGKIESRVLVGSGDAFRVPRAGFVSFVASV
jgi:hypothetical protein